MTSNTKILSIFFCAFLLSVSLSSCLGGSESENIVTGLQNATVKSFSLEDNKDVCANLSKYEFTIDNFGKSDPELAATMPNAGIIFNADSLPAGTVADSIKIEMTYSSVSSVLFKQFDDAGTLKNTVNFADTQYISFDDYAVTRLDLVAEDGVWKKSYFVKINIHKVNGDTIRWQYRVKDLWETAKITDQTVDTIGSKLYWFKEYDNSSLTVCTSDLNGNCANWSAPSNVASTELPVLSTVFNWNGSLYAAGKNGSLLVSTNGSNWAVASNATKFVSILGIQYATKKYDEHLHAVVNEGGAYRFARSFDGTNWEIGDICPENFPVRNFSHPVSDKAKPSAGNLTSRLYIVGGETADGTIISSTWSCDGNSWAEFKQGYLPAMTRPAIIEYTLDSDYPKTFWILWPGVLADGSVKNTAYFSENKGVTWKLLSSEFKSYATTSPIKPVGGVSGVMNPSNYWMYFFGGVDEKGQQQANVFGGQLTSLTFDKIR